MSENSSPGLCGESKKLSLNARALRLFEEREVEISDEDTILESVNSYIPEYIELAKKVDKHAETTYANELVDETLNVFKVLMDIDGNTYANESSFTYAFIDKLEKFVNED